MATTISRNAVILLLVFALDCFEGTGVTSNQTASQRGNFVTDDGTTIFFKDWGTGPAIVFSHGWPLDADAWDAQMLFFGQQGFRVIAHDRRSHGRSTQTWSGNEMDTYADDLGALLDLLDIHDAVLIGHSTGGGEVARYIGRHGTQRVAKAVLLSSVPPLMLQTSANPNGLPIGVFDGIRAAFVADRSQFFKDLTQTFYGYNRPGSNISQGVQDEFWRQGMLGGIKGEFDCIKAFSETDFTEDLKKFDKPTLVMHGLDDQVVPFVASGERSSVLVKGATLITYPGFPHGMAQVHADRINADLLDFIRK